MQYRKLGNTGLELSVLGFGCMRLPIVGGIKLSTDVFDASKPIDENRASALIHTAIENGVNYVDTAYGYHGGQSEVFLGKALQGLREKVVLSTKLPTWVVQGAGDFERLLDEQLKRLQTDYLDIYMLHGLNRAMWGKMKGLDVFSFLEKAREKGRIRHIGFSFHDDIGTFKEIVDGYNWAMCLIQYNYFDEGFQAGRAGLEYAASKGLGVVVMEPMRGGRLTTSIPDEIRAIWDRSGRKWTPAEWALRWVWNQGEVTTALSGMNGEGQLQENIRIANDALPDMLNESDMELIGRVRDAYKDMLKINCTNCAYCMPCPSGVNIPLNFSLYNDTFMFHDPEVSYMMYNHMLAPDFRASNCAECETCLELCPQQINIIEELKKVAEHLKR